MSVPFAELEHPTRFGKKTVFSVLDMKAWES